MAKAKLPPAFPDFLLIGPPEAGADAVKDVLLQHPRIWFPPLDNILAFHTFFQVARLNNLVKLSRREITVRPQHIRWLLQYFLALSPSVKWNSKLFRLKDEAVLKGELSDEYITLPFDEVDKLHRTMPKVKVILIVRNPVERSYAAIREKLARNKKMPFDKLTRRQLLTLMNSDWARSHSSYQRAIDNWSVFFPRSQLFIGFYEDLLQDPSGFMRRIYDFLGLEGELPLDVARLGPKPLPAFPAEGLPYLHPFYRSEIEGLAARLDGHAASWFEKFPLPERTMIERKRNLPPPKPGSKRAAEAEAAAAAASSGKKKK